MSRREGAPHGLADGLKIIMGTCPEVKFCKFVNFFRALRTFVVGSDIQCWTLDLVDACIILRTCSAVEGATIYSLTIVFKKSGNVYILSLNVNSTKNRRIVTAWDTSLFHEPGERNIVSACSFFHNHTNLSLFWFIMCFF